MCHSVNSIFLMLCERPSFHKYTPNLNTLFFPANLPNYFYFCSIASTTHLKQILRTSKINYCLPALPLAGSWYKHHHQSCISDSLLYWWWMILPLSQKNLKSIKFSSHPLFFSSIMHHVWPVSSSATTHTRLGQKPLLLNTSFALASPFTRSQCFEYTPGAHKQIFFLSVLPTTGSSSHFLSFSSTTFPC